MIDFRLEPRAAFGKKKAPAISGSLYRNYPDKDVYFFDLQAQAHPHPVDFSSFFIMQSLPPQSVHFLGLHRPSLVAPHFSHLNTAMLPPPVSG